MRRFIEAPFPRGQTLNQDGELTLTSTIMDYLVGELVLFKDENLRPLVCRIVRADNALTDVGGKAVSFTTGKVGRNVDALTNSDGEISAIIDAGTGGYAVTKDISQYDLFYVVEEGDVDATADSTVNAAELAVMADASGDGVIIATAGSFVIGISNEAVADGIANIRVGSQLKPSDAAS